MARPLLAICTSLILLVGSVLSGRAPTAARADTPYADAATNAAVAAALRIFDGVPQTDCTANNPAQKPCIAVAVTVPASPARGIAVVSVSAPPGAPPSAGLAVMGRVVDGPAGGTWDLWFGTQNPPYQRLDLPGPMRVCADGGTANVRAWPGTDAPVLATLPELTGVDGEEFVLTQPGTVQPLTAGAGWYRSSLPSAGWIHATLLTDARWGDCAVRDGVVHAPQALTAPDVRAARSYPPGWNLVSGPEGSRLQGALGPLYTLQPGDTSYESLPADLPLHGGWGYWAYFPLGGSIDLAAGTAPYLVWPVPGSWVMVGNPSTGTDTYIAGADEAYTYTPGSGYRAVSVLRPGQGAFVSGTARVTIQAVGTPLFP